MDVIEITVNARALPRENFNSFFRAGKKWDSAPEGSTHTLIVVRAEVEAANKLEAEKLYAQGKAIPEKAYADLLKEAKLSVKVMGNPKACQIKPEIAPEEKKVDIFGKVEPLEAPKVEAKK